METQDVPQKTTLSDLRKEAHAHYDFASGAIHHFNSAIPQAIDFYFDQQEKEEAGIPMEDPEWTKYSIQEELKFKAESERRDTENKIHLEYNEKVQLRQYKLEAFKLASNIKPQSYAMGQSLNPYTASDLIRDAEKIYESLIK